MRLTDKKVIKYWQEFRAECDSIADYDGILAEQIPMVDAVLDAVKTIEAQQQEIERLKKQKENILTSHKLLENEIALLREFKSTVRENEEDIWYYMSGENNHIETMVCDLVVRIRADDLRGLVADKIQHLQAQVAKAREALEYYADESQWQTWQSSNSYFAKSYKAPCTYKATDALSFLKAGDNI
jgi:type IV secretory pathway VirD2 relaxase